METWVNQKQEEGKEGTYVKDFKVIEVKRSIFEDNNADADRLRAE